MRPVRPPLSVPLEGGARPHTVVLTEGAASGGSRPPHCCLSQSRVSLRNQEVYKEAANPCP